MAPDVLFDLIGDQFKAGVPANLFAKQVLVPNNYKIKKWAHSVPRCGCANFIFGSKIGTAATARSFVPGINVKNKFADSKCLA
jgi:hypothetical protein